MNRFLESGAIVNVRLSTKITRTPLQEAAERGNLSTVNRLLAAGAKVNANPASDGGLTALQAASRFGHLDVVKCLLDAGADVNANPGKINGFTALQAAACGGHLDIVNILLDSGANVNAVPSLLHGNTALECAAGYCGSLIVVNRLLEAGARVMSPCSTFERFSSFWSIAAGEMHYWEVAHRLHEAYEYGGSQEKWRVVDSLHAAKWLIHTKCLFFIHGVLDKRKREAFASFRRARRTMKSATRTGLQG